MSTTENPPLFDTGALPPADRFTVWNAGIAGVFQGSLPPEADPLSFHAATECRLFGSASIISGELAAVRMMRSRRQATLDSVQTYAVVLYESGEWTGDIPGGRLLAHAGVPVLLDMSRPLSVDAQTGSYLILNLSRELLDELMPADIDLHGVKLEGAPGALLREQLLSLDRHAAGLSASAGDYVAKSVAQGIAACVRGRAVPTPAGDLNLRRQALRQIDRALHDPSLSVDTICEILSVSRSTLYRAFSGADGVMATIRDRRLQRIRNILSDPRDHRSLHELRTLFGFENASHFSTAFFRRFGCNPSSIRDQARSHAASPNRQQLFDHHGWTLL